MPIAIARRDGRLVDALLDAGHPVVPVKPTAIKAWRESEVPSGAKSDAGDAEVIAEYLRLKALGCVRRCPTPRRPRRLRTVSRTPHRPRRRACGGDQQLAALLDAHWPGAKEVFADIASPIRVAFLARYPRCSASAANLGVKWITSTQSGFLHEPCCGLSGAAGAPARPTTVRFTTARRNTSPRRKRPEFAAKGGYRGCDGTTGLP